MQSMRPSIPASVPARATGVLGTSGDITASVATDASALDTKPDARAAPGTAAGTDANSAQGSVTATTPSAVQNDALRKTAQKAGARCIIGSMAYDVTLDGSTFRTMMGVEPEQAADFMEKRGAHIVALNCGTRMDMQRALTAVQRYKSVTRLPVMVQPNAGQPKLVQMKVVYDETPDQMVKDLLPILDAGANIVGACCGSTPDHIRAFRKTMDQYLESKGVALERSRA